MQTLWHRGRAMDFLNQPMFKVENDMHPSIFTLEGTCLLQLQLIISFVNATAFECEFIRLVHCM